MFQLPNHDTQRKFADADSYMMGNSANSALGMRPYFYKFFIIAILTKTTFEKAVLFPNSIYRTCQLGISNLTLNAWF